MPKSPVSSYQASCAACQHVDAILHDATWNAGNYYPELNLMAIYLPMMAPVFVPLFQTLVKKIREKK